MPTNYVEVARISISGMIARSPSINVSVRINKLDPYDIINVILSTNGGFGTMPVPNKLTGYRVNNFSGVLVIGTAVVSDFATRFFNTNAPKDFCDGQTRVRLTASINKPFAIADVEYNSNYCGALPPTLCTLGIDRVDTTEASSTNGIADVIPSGMQPGDVLEFSIDGISPGWISTNIFQNLTAGNYRARVRNQFGCEGEKFFTIYATGEAPFGITKVVTTSETEILNDGTATLTAVGQGAPYTYTLNNGTYQSSPIFTGLAPGGYDALAKNTFGTTFTFPFIIKPYIEYLIKRPSVTLEATNTSRWLAVFNTISFKFKRRDLLFYTIIQDIATNKPKLLFNAPTFILAGSIINVVSEIYKGAYVVHSASGTELVLNTPFIATDNAGFVNVNTKINYRLQIELTIGNEIINGFYTNDATGIISVQIQNRLKKILKALNNFKYDVPNQRDLNAAQSFQIRYREVWEGFTGEWKYETDAYHFVNAAKQIAENYGGNMAEYVTFLNYPTLPKAKFLSGFIEPTYFNGYPFDLSFIYSENILGTIISRKDSFLDINKNIISTSAAVLASDDNTVFLNSDNSLILIEAATITNTALTESVGVHRMKINNNLPTYAKFNNVKLTWLEGVVVKDITETKTIRLNNDCRKVPVYLCWLNTLGGWDYWLFDISQKSELNTGNVKTYEKYVEDFENGDGFVETLSKDAQVKLTVGDNDLEMNDFHGIKGILYSPKVLMLISQAPRWLTVQIDAKSFSYETDKGSTDIEFSIILPNINIQTQ